MVRSHTLEQLYFYLYLIRRSPHGVRLHSGPPCHIRVLMAVDLLLLIFYTIY